MFQIILIWSANHLISIELEYFVIRDNEYQEKVALLVVKYKVFVIFV